MTVSSFLKVSYTFAMYGWSSWHGHGDGCEVGSQVAKMISFPPIVCMLVWHKRQRVRMIFVCGMCGLSNAWGCNIACSRAWARMGSAHTTHTINSLLLADN